MCAITCCMCHLLCCCVTASILSCSGFSHAPHSCQCLTAEAGLGITLSSMLLSMPTLSATRLISQSSSYRPQDGELESHHDAFFLLYLWQKTLSNRSRQEAAHPDSAFAQSLPAKRKFILKCFPWRNCWFIFTINYCQTCSIWKVSQDNFCCKIAL